MAAGTAWAPWAPFRHRLFAAMWEAQDQHRYDAISALTDPAHPTAVTHWLTPELRRGLEWPQKGGPVVHRQEPD